MRSAWLVVGAVAALAAGLAQDKDAPGAIFGTTVVAPFGFCGRLYPLPEGQLWLPKFEKLRPLGIIYTNSLNVPPRDFSEGFPGAPGRFEWFAIDYKARFWVQAPGKYEFELMSDDGSNLYIDERRIIDNDGGHQPQSSFGKVNLEGGLHDIRVSYFQGPRYQVALVLKVKDPTGKWRIFDTREFKPPSNPADWKFAGSPFDLPVDPFAPTPRSRRLISRADAEPRHLQYRAQAYRFKSDETGSQFAIVFGFNGASLQASPNAQGKKYSLNLSLVAVVKNADGQVVDRFDKDVVSELSESQLTLLRSRVMTYTGTVRVAPGRYTVETEVVDREGGTTSVSAFPIESLAGRGIGLSDVLLIQGVQPLDDKPDRTDPFQLPQGRAIPEMSGVLKAGTTPSVYFIAYPDKSTSAKPRYSVTALLDGAVMGEESGNLPEADATGTIPIVLRTLARSGNWEIRVTLQQGGNSTTQSLKYSIER